MRRREFIAGLGSVAAWPVAAWAQQPDRVQALLNRILYMQAEATAAKISQFIREIEGQMGWITELSWSAGTMDQRRFDSIRLLRQVPAITELSQLDATGKEMMKVSRLASAPVASQADFSQDPDFTVTVVDAVGHTLLGIVGAMKKKVYYGPVYFRRQGEPYMTLSFTSTRRDAATSASASLRSISSKSRTWFLRAKSASTGRRMYSTRRTAWSFRTSASFSAIRI
jgi:hypothetical protein